jgi:hypothetical protein
LKVSHTHDIQLIVRIQTLGGYQMGNLATIGIFFAGFFGGFGIFFGGIAFLWWCSLYSKIHFPEEKKNKE